MISFQDYSAVCIGTTGVNGDDIGHIRLCEYDKAENKDPITRILYDVFQDLKSSGDPIPLYMFGHLARGDYSVEKYIRFLSEACQRYINQGLSEEKIDELVDWFDKWWSEFERKIIRRVVVGKVFLGSWIGSRSLMSLPDLRIL